VLWAVLLTTLYAASLGPASWLVDRGIVPSSGTRLFYEPLLTMIKRSPGAFRTSAIEYCDLFSRPNDDFVPSAGHWWILTAP
jgi:hypothetical protein